MAHSPFAKGEWSDIGIQTKQQSWEQLQPTKGTFCEPTSGGPLYPMVSVVLCEQLPG